MQKASLQDFLKDVEARKVAAGVTDEVLAAARNSGERRTPEKREAIRRIQQRALDANLKPLTAFY